MFSRLFKLEINTSGTVIKKILDERANLFLTDSDWQGPPTAARR